MNNSTNIRRLINEAKMINDEPLEDFDVYPQEDNLYIWYFLLKGKVGTAYEGGYYVGKICHSENYPFSPPKFMMMTPNGRFIINEQICLSNSNYHANEWSPSWNIVNILIGFYSIFMDDKEHGLSHIHESSENRQRYAKAAVQYNKQHNSEIIKGFTRFLNENGYPITNPGSVSGKDVDHLEKIFTKLTTTNTSSENAPTINVKVPEIKKEQVIEKKELSKNRNICIDMDDEFD